MAAWLVLFLIALTLSQQPPDTLLVPFPVLPSSTATVPSLTNKHLLVTGCRGIALEVVLQAHALGATIVCTTRNKATFNYSSVPSAVEVWELDYCKKKFRVKTRF